MKASSYIVSPVIKFLLTQICRVESSELKKVPMHGPLIIVINHINFLEVPLLYTHLFPRNVIGIIKAETWDNPFMGFLANTWSAIAINRQGMDLAAMRKSLDVLKNGGILILAPEGTRSGNGILQKGHGGVVELAIKSGAPILPIAHFGGEKFWYNFKHVRRTAFKIKVGKPFILIDPNKPETRPRSVAKRLREEMTNDIMYNLSALLPELQRGVYPNPEEQSKSTIKYITT